ncbi:glycosyltransferase family 39 protein, partial [Crocinitomix sp.]|nr:glycosyltransferase family 39 protein [Crocinitomix sp.]
MDFLKRNIDILLILALGFVLRFSVSMIHSYSNDELSAVTRLRFDNFSDLVEFGVKTGDMHPAGVQFFMKFWSYIAGTSEVGMRFPFVIFGTLSILVVFLIGKQWFNRKVGLYASGLLAVLYFPIMNSEFARPYSPGLLICLLVGFFIHKVLFDFDKKWRNAVILGLLFAAAMYTHYFAFLFVGFIGVSGLIFINKSNWKQLFLAGLIGLSLFLPHYQITEFHLNVGGLQWLPPPNSTWLLAFLSHAFNASWIVISLLIVMVALGVYFGRNEIPFQKRNIVLLII